MDDFDYLVRMLGGEEFFLEAVEILEEAEDVIEWTGVNRNPFFLAMALAQHRVKKRKAQQNPPLTPRWSAR